MTMPGPDGKTMHAEMSWQDSVIMFGAMPEVRMEEMANADRQAVQGVRSPIEPLRLL